MPLPPLQPSQISPPEIDYSSLVGTLNPMLGLLGLGAAQQQEDLDSLHAQVQQAQQAAAQAGQRYSDATQQPQGNTGNFYDQLAGNTASVLSGNQDYQRQAYERGKQQEQELLKARADNLAALKANYEANAHAAERMGNTELAAQYRAKVDQTSRNLLGIIQAGMKGQQQTYGEQQKQAGRMELQNLKGDQAKVLEELRQKGRLELKRTPTGTASDAELAFDNEVFTTGTGRQFLDISNFVGNTKNGAIMYAGKLGIPALSKEQRGTLDDLEATRDNLDAIMASVFDKLPENEAERPVKGASNRLAAMTQTDPDLAAFNTYWSNTVRAMRATAGSRGLRINRSEIERALKYDTISLWDTKAAAKQKIANIKRLLENAESPLLDRDWRANEQAKPDYNSIPAHGSMEIVTPDGKRITIDVADWPKAFRNGAARVYPGT